MYYIHACISIKKEIHGDFAGGPEVKNPSCCAGDAGSIPGQGTKIQHAAGQLSLCATTREKPAHHNETSRRPQLRPNVAKNK